MNISRVSVQKKFERCKTNQCLYRCISRICDEHNECTERNLTFLLINDTIFWSGNDALQFSGDNVEEYGIARGLQKPLTAVSSCFSINMLEGYEENHGPTVISYAYDTLTTTLFGLVQMPW